MSNGSLWWWILPFAPQIFFGSTRGPGQPIAPRRLMPKAQSVTGFYLPAFASKPELLHEGMEFLTRHALERKLTPSVARVLPLAVARHTRPPHALRPA